MLLRKASFGIALLLGSGVCLLVTEFFGAASNLTSHHVADAKDDRAGDRLLSSPEDNNTAKSSVIINPDTLFTRRGGLINSFDRGIFTKDDSNNNDDRIRRPVYPPSSQYHGLHTDSSGKKGRPDIPYGPIRGGIFSRPSGPSPPSVSGNRGKVMKIKLANFSVRIRGDKVDKDELLGTLEHYLLSEMGQDFRTLSAIELKRIFHLFGGTVFVGFVSKENVIDSQINALRDCISLQAAVDRNVKIANGPAVVDGIYIDVTPPLTPIVCSQQNSIAPPALPPITLPIPKPAAVPSVDPLIEVPSIVRPTKDPTNAPATLPPETPPVFATPTLSPVTTPTAPSTIRPTQTPILSSNGPPMSSTTSPPPVGMASDFDRACTEGASFLYVSSEASEVDCTCSRQETDILCTRPGSRSASCFSGSIEVCAESYERWVFTPEKGTLQAIELCRDCLGSDCDEQGLSRDECLRLEYAGSDITGCAILRTYDAPPPAVLPECGSCNLCNAAQFADPGIIHTCPGYEGRPDQGFLVDANMCHSTSLDVLFNVGFRFPRTYGELPPITSSGEASTVAPGCCAGNVEPCDFFTSEAGCLSQTGCAFGFGLCFGEADSCGVFDYLEACDGQGGCGWTCT